MFIPSTRFSVGGSAVSFPLSVYRFLLKPASARTEEPMTSVTKLVKDEEHIKFWISRVDNDVKYEGGDAAKAKESEFFT
jgi:hypothetical protein